MIKRGDRERMGGGGGGGGYALPKEDEKDLRHHQWLITIWLESD